MTTQRKPQTFRQALFSSSYDPDAPYRHRFYLETLKRGQKGPRRQFRITGEGERLMADYMSPYVCSGTSMPVGVMLDWLEDHPEDVKGMKAEDVRIVIAAMRERGGSFVR